MGPPSAPRPDPPIQVTELLVAWREGDQTALDRLMPLVHAELQRLARRYMRGERRGNTLQTTALVHETYLRLLELTRVQWQDREHFFAMVARLMRRILVDHARAKAQQKRGGGVRPLPLDEAMAVAVERGVDMVALDDALQALASFHARQAQVIELRYFGGLSVADTAVVLSVSVETVARDWRMGKAWLLRELGGGDAG